MGVLDVAAQYGLKTIINVDKPSEAVSLALELSYRSYKVVIVHISDSNINVASDASGRTASEALSWVRKSS